MMLYINGQDIGQFVLGRIDERVQLETFQVGPERYLETIESFLHSLDVRLDHIRGIILVTGPGSPTALRTSLSIANTLHFAKRIPILVMQKPADVADEDVVTKERVGALIPLAQDVFAQPVYATGPRITASKKDALGRKITS